MTSMQRYKDMSELRRYAKICRTIDLRTFGDVVVYGITTVCGRLDKSREQEVRVFVLVNLLPEPDSQ